MLEFDLPTNQLLCYAIIYGHCQTGENCYYGSTENMAELLGLKKGKGHASEYMNELESKGLLRKEEVKNDGKQRMCKYYVTTSISGRVEEQNIDYITIQPWMFKTMGLKNNLLIIYARIQNLSRSNNIYLLSYSDLAKWASCEKRKIRGYINDLIKLKAIELNEIAKQEGYKAIIPENISNSQKWNTLPKNGTPIPKNGTPLPKSGTPLPKNGTNNNIYNLIDNLIDNSSSTKNISFNEEEWKKKIEYEGLYFSERQLRDVKKLIDEANKLSTTKENILFFLGRMYDDHLRMFKIGDTEIYNLYGFVKSAFSGKITKDGEKQKELITKFKEENTDLIPKIEYDTETANRKPVDMSEVEDWLKNRNKN